MIQRGAVESLIAAGYLALGLHSAPLLALTACAWPVGLGAPAWAPRAPRAMRVAPTVIAVIAAAASCWLAGFEALLGVQAALVLLQLHRRLERADGDDDRVSIVLSGLMLVTAATATDAPSFVGMAGAWGAVLPWALSDGRAGLPRAWFPPYLALAALFFVALPRVTPTADRSARWTGFAPDVDLSALEPLLDDPAVVFRALPSSPMPGPVYWRGVALDGFDGQRWYSAEPPTSATSAGGGGGVVVRVTPASLGSGALFLPGRPTRITASAPLRADRAGAWWVSAEASGAPYVVEVAPPHGPGPWFDETQADTTAWTRLPAMPPAIAELAVSVGGAGDARARVDRWAGWLRTEGRYRRDAKAGLDQGVVRFLLDTREGHCGHFAAGLAVMARSQGVPARVVNGFVGGELNPLTGEIVVRRQHAHSWTEILLDGRWELVDPTPPSARAPLARSASSTWRGWWEGEVVPFDRDRQHALLWRVGGLVEGALRLSPTGLPWRGLAALAAVALALSWVLRRAWRAARASSARVDPVSREHARARAAVARRCAVDPSLPPVEAATSLRGQLPDDAVDALLALAWLTYDVRLGGADPEAHREQAAKLADRVVGSGRAS
jgi:transglutaminase-like putative cysteine protease